MITKSHPACGLLIHLEHRLRDLADWIGTHYLPPSWSVSIFCCEHHESGQIKPCVSLVLTFATYKEALAWAWLNCKCHDSDKGVDAREYHTGAFTMPLIDFEVRCVYPEETRWKPEEKSLAFA
jgi:hypothetical protein